MQEITKKNKSIPWEIVRFIITGVVATIVDFGVSSLIALPIPDSWGVWETVICTAAGFLVSLVVNWVLSTFWVYKNVDESVNAKSTKNVLLFTLFSLIGLGIGLGIMAIFTLIGNNCLHVDFMNWLEFLKDSSKPFDFWKFFWFCLFFGIKTLIVLFWNYISRKKFIYKSPEDIAKSKEK